MNEQYMNSSPTDLTYKDVGYDKKGNLIIHIYSQNTHVATGTGYVNSKTLIVSIYPYKVVIPRTMFDFTVKKIPFAKLAR